MTQQNAASESLKSILGTLDQEVRRTFEENQRILSFDEYLGLVSRSPERQLRGSAQYLADLMDHFGKTKVELASRTGEAHSGNLYHFSIFDRDENGRRVVGHEAVQTELYRSLRTFARLGMTNKMLLLHGPNGSAKSSLIHSLMTGMERYSHAPEGAVYRFNWIFPLERYTRGAMGIGSSGSSDKAYADSGKDPHQSFARIPDEEVLARIPCDMKDHPFLLIPVESRKSFLEKLLGNEAGASTYESLPQHLRVGDLCHRCKKIADNLLNANGGELKRVLAHVQVERFFYSKRYRDGLVTIEPQLHVDAHYQQLTMSRSMGSLPATLQSLNLFSVSGDLVDGNRGIVEYSDLLKRPVDSFKYLLVACETGAVTVGHSIAQLDMVMLGSANDLQLDAFKEFPDFMSFKGRIELIRVPYLLSVSDEQSIYEKDIEQISHEKHVAPHTAWSLALWTILTRLKKPNSINYPPSVSTLISSLSPLDKTRLYDTGEMPGHLSPEDRKVLKSSIKRLREEYINIPYYEGRMGASAREMKSVLHSAAQNTDYACLSPLSILRELEDFVKRVSEYEFLKQDIKDGYHDNVEFIATVRNEYLTRLDREVRDAIGIYDSAQWEEFLKKYVQHISLLLKKEKIKNPITGKMEDPDTALIDEFEKIVEAPGSGSGTQSEKEAFRQNMISTVGAWVLDHPGQVVTYAKVFPELWKRLEKHYFDSQKALLTKMHNALKLYGTDDPSITEDGAQLAQRTVENMVKNKGYCASCARDAISFLMRQRY